MKISVQRETGLGEVTVIETDTLSDLPETYKRLDDRLQQHNAKVVEARQFVQQVKDPNYRYLFTAFLDQFLGLSSSAQSLLQRFNLQPPEGFDSWVAAQDAHKPKDPGPPVRRIK